MENSVFPVARPPGCLQQSWSFSLPLIKSLSPIRGLIARDETESIQRPTGFHYERWPSWMPNRRRDSVCPRNANELPMRTFDSQTVFKASKSPLPRAFTDSSGSFTWNLAESRSLSRRSRADEYTPLNYRLEGGWKEQRKARVFSPLQTRFGDISRESTGESNLRFFRVEGNLVIVSASPFFLKKKKTKKTLD